MPARGVGMAVQPIPAEFNHWFSDLFNKKLGCHRKIMQCFSILVYYVLCIKAAKSLRVDASQMYMLSLLHFMLNFFLVTLNDLE